MSLAEARRMAFEASLDVRDLAYQEFEGQVTSGVEVGFNLYNLRDLKTYFWFQPDGETVHVTTNCIAWVPEDRRERALEAVNEVNLRWRWASFFVEEGSIVAAADILLVDHLTGETCADFLLHRFIAVINDVYPLLMRRLWADDAISDNES